MTSVQLERTKPTQGTGINKAGLVVLIFIWLEVISIKRRSS